MGFLWFESNPYHLYLSPQAKVSLGCPGWVPHGIVSVMLAATETAMKKPVT